MSFLFWTSSNQGIFWKFFSTFFFVVVTVLCFQLERFGAKVPPFQLAFFQAFLPLLFLSLFQINQFSGSFRTLLLTTDPRNALGRAFCACIGFLAWFWALRLLPLGIVATFRLLGPLVTFAAAILFLRELPTKNQCLALVGTVLGVAFLLQHELLSGEWDMGPTFFTHLFLPLTAIFGFSGAHIFGKKLLKQATPWQATFSLLMISSLILGICAIPFWQWPSPSQWGLLLAVGVLDALAQWSLSKALSLTHLSLLVPISLWRFALTALSGVLFFGEPFHLSLWIGVTLIALMTGVIVRRG